MDSTEVGRILSELPELRVSVAGDQVRCHVPAIDDTVCLGAAAVRRCRPIFGPRGERAVEFVVDADDGDVRPLIVTGDDVVYAPADAAGLLDSAIPYRVGNAPPLVAYSEMQRDAEALARTAEQGTARLDLSEVGGTALLLRCFVAGAVRFGMRPVRTVAWWRRAWASIGEDVVLPPFRRDPLWEELYEQAAGITDAGPSDADRPAAADQQPSEPTVADFHALAPLLTVSRLDQEFVESWTRWVRADPASFARTLCEGLDGARAEVTLYPDGGGEVDLRVDAAGTCVGLLQLGFSFPEDTFTLDELRVSEPGRGTGLFQRLVFNAERLGALLGFTRIDALATGIGSYALAASGYPRDPELRRGRDTR